MKPRALVVTSSIILGAMGLVLLSQTGRTPSVGQSRVLVIGDSLGVGLGRALQAARYNVTTQAVEGTSVSDWQGAVLQKAMATAPTVVLISLGTNDAYAGDSHATAAVAAVDRLLATLQQSGAAIYWLEPPTLPGSYGQKSKSQAVLDAIKSAVRKAPWVRWVASDALILERSPDKLHPTPNGYATWAAILANELGLSHPIQPPPPEQVTVPAGWARIAANVSPAQKAFADAVLEQRRPIGDVREASIDGKTIGALTEYHWDDHVDHTWQWHRGVSLLSKTGETS